VALTLNFELFWISRFDAVRVPPFQGTCGSSMSWQPISTLPPPRPGISSSLADHFFQTCAGTQVAGVDCGAVGSLPSAGLSVLLARSLLPEPPPDIFSPRLDLDKKNNLSSSHSGSPEFPCLHFFCSRSRSTPCFRSLGFNQRYLPSRSICVLESFPYR